MRRSALIVAWLATTGCSSSDAPQPETPAPRVGEDGVPEVVATELPEEEPAGRGAAPEPPPATPAPTPEVPEVAVVAECRLPSLARSVVGSELTGLVYTRAGGRARRLDLSLPQGEGPHPLVVLVHGGGWRAGDRSHLDEERTILAGRGYATASVDYRKVPDTFPAAVADVRCAVRWLRANAAQHGLDVGRVALAGFSAGAHLAALTAVAPEVVALDDTCEHDGDASAQAAIAFYGPADLRAEAGWPVPTTRIITRFLGTAASEDPTRATLASPIAHVGPGDPPMMLVHGTADSTVPLEQSVRFRDALQAAGVRVTYVEIEGGRHGFPLFAPRASLRAAPCTALAFLEAHLRAQ